MPPRKGRAAASALIKSKPSNHELSALSRLSDAIPMKEVAFEMPPEILEEKMKLKLAHVEIEPKPFGLPPEYTAPLIARERPPKFNKISRNVFTDSTLKIRRPRVAEIEKCTCKAIDDKNRKLKQNEMRSVAVPSPAGRKRAAAAMKLESEGEIEIQACGEDCLNRAVQQECTDVSCSYTDATLCTNRQLTRKEHVNVTPIRTEMKGWGLFVDVAVTAGQFLHEYVGDVISTETCINRLKQQYSSAKKDRATHSEVHHYFLTLGENMVIDAQKRGGVCRFLNHSCNPNCEIQIWSCNNEPHAGLFARRDITAGSELTIDYMYDGLDKDIIQTQPCFCGESTCAKVIGGERKTIDSKKANKKRKMGKQAQKRMRQLAQDLASDSVCSICGEAGELMLCDGTVDGRDCPRCYHYTCLNKEQVPAGKWICPYHFCDGCGKTPVVFCRTCSDSWCKTCAADSDLKPAAALPGDSGRVKFVICSDCVKVPLNPVRDAQAVSRTLQEVYRQKALAERILKGQKTEGEVQLELGVVEFQGLKISKEHMALLVAVTIGKKTLTDALRRQLANKLNVHENKLDTWFEANQVLLENPLNFVSDEEYSVPSLLLPS